MGFVWSGLWMGWRVKGVGELGWRVERGNGGVQCMTGMFEGVWGEGDVAGDVTKMGIQRCK